MGGRGGHEVSALVLTHLVDGGSHRALQQHLQHLGVGLLSVRGHRQLSGLLLHVLDGHFNGSEVKLRARAAALLRWPTRRRAINAVACWHTGQIPLILCICLQLGWRWGGVCGWGWEVSD